MGQKTAQISSELKYMKFMLPYLDKKLCSTDHETSDEIDDHSKKQPLYLSFAGKVAYNERDNKSRNIIGYENQTWMRKRNNSLHTEQGRSDGA